MAITNVKGDGFTMEWLKVAEIGVVDQHEFANLFLVEHLARSKAESTHIGDKPYKETISIEQGVMVPTN